MLFNISIFVLRKQISDPYGILAEALTAWCALAVAAKEPFYSEEANDSPEVDAGLDGPMEQPTDDFERHANNYAGYDNMYDYGKSDTSSSGFTIEFIAFDAP